MFYEVYQDASRHWRWRLQASNGRTIANAGVRQQGRLPRGRQPREGVGDRTGTGA